MVSLMNGWRCVRCGWTRSSQRWIGWCMNWSHRSQTKMCQIFESRQIGKFNVKWIDQQPAPKASDDQQNPQENHGDVVEENQVIDNCKEERCKKAQNCKNGKCPKPWTDLCFVFLAQSNDQNNWGHQHSASSQKREQRKHYEKVSDWKNKAKFSIWNSNK